MLDRYAHPRCGLSHASLACMRAQPNPGCRLTTAALAGTTLLSRGKRFELPVDKTLLFSHFYFPQHAPTLSISHNHLHKPKGITLMLCSRYSPRGLQRTEITTTDEAFREFGTAQEDQSELIMEPMTQRFDAHAVIYSRYRQGYRTNRIS